MGRRHGYRSAKADVRVEGRWGKSISVERKHIKGPKTWNSSESKYKVQVVEKGMQCSGIALEREAEPHQEGLISHKKMSDYVLRQWRALKGLMGEMV